MINEIKAVNVADFSSPAYRDKIPKKLMELYGIIVKDFGIIVRKIQKEETTNKEYTVIREKLKDRSQEISIYESCLTELGHMLSKLLPVITSTTEALSVVVKLITEFCYVSSIEINELRIEQLVEKHRSDTVRLREKDEEVIRLKAEIEQLNKHIVQLETINSQIEKDLLKGGSTAISSDAEEHLKDLDNDLKLLNDEELRHMKDQLEKTQSELETLEEINKELAEEMERKEESLNKAIEKVQCLKEECQQKDGIITDFGEKISEYDEQLKNKERESDFLATK